MPTSEAEAIERPTHAFADLPPDPVATIVAECFAVIDLTEGRSVAALRAEELARARLESRRAG